MKYVKYFDIVGVDTAQIPCIELQGAPNAATVGAVGLLGMDMTSTSHDLYKCVKVEGSVYTWEKVVCGKDGTNIVKAEINDLGELVLTLSDGNTINAGKVKGADGKDGTNGTNGKDGCEITNITISDKNELLVETSDGKVINAGVLPTGKGEAGVSVVKAEFNESGDLVLTLSSGELLTVGHVIPTLQDWLGKLPIGDESHYIYYDGEKFVSRAVSIKDETTEWAQIALMSEQISKGEKTPKELGLAVGQERTVTLTTGEEVTFVILGFNHDDLADSSGKAGITFGMRDLLATTYDIHETTPTNNDGGIGDTLLPSILTEIYNTLPSDLKDCIKSVIKTGGVNRFSNSTGSGAGTSSNITYTETTKMFLFSDTELGATNTDYKGGVRYQYYKSFGTSTVDNRPVKGLAGVGAHSYVIRGVRQYWVGSTEWFSIVTINSAGRITQTKQVVGEMSNKTGICFGFCI